MVAKTKSGTLGEEGREREEDVTLTKRRTEEKERKKKHTFLKVKKTAVKLRKGE